MALMLSQTACSGALIANIAASLVAAITKAESAAVSNPQVSAYLAAASVCASDFSGLYANGATPTLGQAVQVASECLIAAPVVPGESPEIAAAIDGVGIALAAISAFLPQPVQAHIRSLAKTAPDTKMPRPFFGPYYDHKINKAHTAALALKVHFGQ